MEVVDRTLIGLNLILQQFGVTVATPLMVNSDPPNMDVVCAAIVLVQLIHPLGYKFSLIQYNGRHTLRSSKLDQHIVALRNKTSKGYFILKGKRIALSQPCKSKVERVLNSIRPPEDFDNSRWLFLVGLWAALGDEALAVMLLDYPDFLPYVDYAEEQITAINSYAKRNVL